MTESVFYDDRSGRLEKLRAIDVAVIDCAQGRGENRDGSPAKIAQKDRDARWNLKRAKAAGG
jgi:hypothetical protein